MQWTSTEDRFGLVLITLHWVMAALVFFLFFLGSFMVRLSYVHPWYHGAPLLHKGLGAVLFALLVFRVLWRVFIDRRPPPVAMPALERVTARAVQSLVYVFMFGLVVSGYLVPTARGRGLDVFGLFEVPALVWGLARQEDIAGDVHRALAYAIMGLVLVHTIGALKHHFIDRDETLLRMLFIGKKEIRRVS